MEFLASITHWHWLILGVALIGIEVFAPSTLLLWPGVAAIVVGLLSALIPGLNIYVELVLFGVLAISSSILWLVKFKKPSEATDQPQLNRRASQYIGRRIVLREAFEDGSGYLVIDDSRWRAEAEDGANLESGTRVEVTGVDGVTLKVVKLADES